MVDNGDGIELNYLNCFIECFYCVDKVCFCKIGGFGLGFFIVKYVLSYYNFCLDIISILGEGSNFLFVLDNELIVE